MYSPVPIVRAAARVDVELLADAIDPPPQVTVLQLAEWIPPRAFEVQVRDQQPSEMCRVRDAAACTGDRCIERKDTHDQDENLRGNREHEVHVDRTIGEVE